MRITNIYLFFLLLIFSLSPSLAQQNDGVHTIFDQLVLKSGLKINGKIKTDEIKIKTAFDTVHISKNKINYIKLADDKKILDIIYLKSGDQLSGRIYYEHLDMATEDGVKSIKMNRIQIVRFGVENIIRAKICVLIRNGRDCRFMKKRDNLQVNDHFRIYVYSEDTPNIYIINSNYDNTTLLHFVEEMDVLGPFFWNLPQSDKPFKVEKEKTKGRITIICSRDKLDIPDFFHSTKIAHGVWVKKERELMLKSEVIHNDDVSKPFPISGNLALEREQKESDKGIVLAAKPKQKVSIDDSPQDSDLYLEIDESESFEYADCTDHMESKMLTYSGKSFIVTTYSYTIAKKLSK